MVFSQPSSPVLKARRQRRRLYSRLFYVACAVITAIWFVRYVLLDGQAHEEGTQEVDTEGLSKPTTTIPPTRKLPGHQPPLLSVSQPGNDGKAASVHVHHPFVPGATHLTAILPTTQEAISGLDAHLRTLLEHPGNLADIIILAPQQLHSKARHIIRTALSSEDDLDVEITIQLWPDSLELGTALVQAAQKLSADWVLLLDEDGLQKLSTISRDALLLRAAPPMALPVGPRGIDYHLDGITCIAPSPARRRAAYLVPPLVLPTELIPPSLDTASGIDAWAALGDYAAKSASTLSGGLVLGSPEEPTDNWCLRYAPTGLNGAPLPIHSLFDEAHMLSDDIHTKVDADNSHDISGTVLLVLGADDSRYLLPVACALLNKGHHVVVLAEGEDRTATEPVCDLTIRVVLPLEFPWTKASHPNVPEAVDVLLSVLNPEHPSHLATALANRYRTVTHVQIPEADLPYTDWMSALGIEEWKNWHTPRIELSVITNDRPHSLRRLLRSLNSARYFGDALDVRINIEQTADEATLQMASEYAWPHGSVFLHRRVVHGGLLTAVVESWYPKGNHSYGLILEDDVEVSPLFYAYLKLSLLRYRYGKTRDRSPHLFGISLYQQKNLELRPEGRHLFDARVLFANSGIAHPHTPYLSQIPCSWGALYFPEHWREFHAYLAERLSHSASDSVCPAANWQTVVPGVRSNRWTRSWKRFFIELVYLRGYVMLYPNYAGFASLSTNHLEVGSHVKDVPAEVYLRKKKLFNVPLMPLPSTEGGAGPLPATGLLELPDERMPAWNALPVLDLLGEVADQQTILQRGAERRTELTGCDEPTLQLHNVKELLCTQ